MKQFAGTLATVALLGALAGYYFLVDLPQEEKELQETRQSARVVPHLLDQVHDFIYQHRDLKVYAVKEGITWKLKEPVAALGDHMTINGMLQELENTRHLRVVEESPQDLGAYGLKNPGIQITLKEDTFGEETVLIGDESPIGHSAYWKTAADPRVLLVPGFRKNWIKTLYDFRDKTLLRLKPESITALTLTRPQNVLKLEKKEDGWVLTSPIKAHGDPGAIGDLISKMKHSRAEAFVEESPKNLAPYGLAAPAHAALFSDGKDTWELFLGNAKEEGRIHAKLKTQANVVLVESKMKDWMETSHLDLIDKRVLTFEENEIAEIEITGPSGKLHLVKSEGDQAKWTIKGAGEEADQAVINGLLFDLKEVRALEFISFGEPENFGLKPPAQTLTLKNKNGNRQSLSLGNHNLGGKKVYLARSLDNGIFALEKEQADKIFRPVDDFKNRRPIHLEESKANRIVLTYPAATFELERSDGGWNLLRPEKIEGLKPYIGNDILWTLNNLQIEKEIASPTPEEKKLASPSLALAVFDANKTPLVEVRVGPSTRDPNLLVSRISGHDAPLLIQNRFLDEIPHELEKFRNSKNTGN